MTARIRVMRACAGYAAAVTTATASATLTFGISFGVWHWKDLGLLASVVGCGIFIAALLPYPIVICYANRKGERGCGFFVCTGLATALLGLILLALVPLEGDCGDSYGPTLIRLLELSLHFAAAGISGGTASWLVLKSKHDEDTLPALCCAAGRVAGAGPLERVAGKPPQ